MPCLREEKGVGGFNSTDAKDTTGRKKAEWQRHDAGKPELSSYRVHFPCYGLFCEFRTTRQPTCQLSTLFSSSRSSEVKASRFLA